MKNKKSMPVIKEKRISKIVKALDCFDKYSYNRDKQRDCVLELYPNTSEKSTFRGMIIPTLRYLGLIIGYGGLIRISANGKLILMGRENRKGEMLRILRAIILELDKNFGFIEELKNPSREKPVDKKDFVNFMSDKVEGPSDKQIEERIKNWTAVLMGCNLFGEKNGKIVIKEGNLKRAKRDLEIHPKKRKFKGVLFEKYKSLPDSERAGGVHISTLRKITATHFYEEYGLILTENQFDRLLSEMGFVTDDYILNFGRPMGADEKLFKKDGEYYKTLGIKFLNKE